MSSFLAPQLRDVVERMSGYRAHWCVAGGWAIDLFLNRLTRPHRDIEVAVLRKDQALLRRHLSGWSFQQVVEGRREPWPEDQTLLPPVHEIHAKGSTARPGGLEILLNEGNEAEWVFRRDPQIRLPTHLAILSGADGVPILCPEIVLLYKAKHPRDKDQADFDAVLPHLSPSQRLWLSQAIERVNPSHDWVGRVSRADRT